MDNKAIRRFNLLQLKAQHRTWVKLAELTGGDAAHFSQISTGHREMGEDVARRIEAGLKLPHGWMDALRANNHQGTYNVEAIPVRTFDWPVVAWVAAGLRAEAIEAYEREDAPTTAFDLSPERGDYALQVRGDSMIRADGTGFPDGCYIAVQHARKPRSGDFVVVRFNHTDEATFKQYFIDGPVKLLKPLNPAWPTIQLSPDAQIVGVVGEKRTIERF